MHGFDPQGAEYRLPEKARTIGEMLAEARQRSGAQKLSGHDIMALERFDSATRHMIVFDVLTHDSPVGWKGEKMRLFLTDTGYSKALENQENHFFRYSFYYLKANQDWSQVLFVQFLQPF